MDQGGADPRTRIRMGEGGLPWHPEHTPDRRDGRKHKDQAAQGRHDGRLGRHTPWASQREEEEAEDTGETEEAGESEGAEETKEAEGAKAAGGSGHAREKVMDVAMTPPS